MKAPENAPGHAPGQENGGGRFFTFRPGFAGALAEDPVIDRFIYQNIHLWKTIKNYIKIYTNRKKWTECMLASSLSVCVCVWRRKKMLLLLVCMLLLLFYEKRTFLAQGVEWWFLGVCFGKHFSTMYHVETHSTIFKFVRTSSVTRPSKNNTKRPTTNLNCIVRRQNSLYSTI